MIRKILGFVLLISFTLPSLSQAQTKGTPASSVASDVVTANANTTEGLELPADQTVRYDEGFVTIQAKCSGEVKWLVVSGVKIKYFTLPANNTIIVSVPPSGGLITVFAVGLVGGKLTEFVRTSITVTPNAPAPPTPNPNPTPTPLPTNVNYHVTFVMDLNNMTPALGQIINSQKVRDAVTSKSGMPRLYDINDPKLKQTGLDKIVAQNGGAPMIIIQRSDGNVAVGGAKKMPATEAEVVQYLNQILQ